MIEGENQPFASPSDALRHAGVKGMKWGVINEELPSGKDAAAANARTKEWMAASNVPKPKVTKQQAAVNLAENKAKFVAKFDDTTTAVATPKTPLTQRLTPEQKKKAIKVGLAGALQISQHQQDHLN